MTDTGQWLSAEQIRKRVRKRRTAVIAAMDAGELPHERRGRLRFSPLWAVEDWERKLVDNADGLQSMKVPVEFLDVL